MTKKLDQKTVQKYIPLLVKALRLPEGIQTSRQYFQYIRDSSPSRDGISWEERVSNWRSQGILTYCPYGVLDKWGSTSVMPVFPQLWARVSRQEPYNKEKEIMIESVKSTANAVIDQNKEAGVLAAELTVGRTANEFLVAKVIKTLPWYKRWFVKDNSWLGKLIVAQAANAIIQQTSDNKRLQRIGDAMLKESVVEATVYSDQITGLINGLEEAVSMPFLDKIMPEK
jgi:hypothetical protein